MNARWKNCGFPRENTRSFGSNWKRYDLSTKRKLFHYVELKIYRYHFFIIIFVLFFPDYFSCDVSMLFDCAITNIEKKTTSASFRFRSRNSTFRYPFRYILDTWNLRIYYVYVLELSNLCLYMQILQLMWKMWE